MRSNMFKNKDRSVLLFGFSIFARSSVDKLMRTIAEPIREFRLNVNKNNVKIPLSSPHQFNTKKSLLSSPQNPSVQYKCFSSTPKKRKFNKPVTLTQPSLKHINRVSTTHPSVRFSLELKLLCVELTVVLYWHFFFVELPHLTCWTDEFRGLKRCGPYVEIMCWTEGVCVEQRGTRTILPK